MNGACFDRHFLVGNLQSAQKSCARQNPSRFGTAKTAVFIDNCHIRDGRFAHIASLVKSDRHIFCPAYGFRGHKHIGQIVHALDPGQIFLLGRIGACKCGKSPGIKIGGRQFGGQGNNIETGIGTFCRRYAKSARPARKKNADIALVAARSMGHGANKLPGLAHGQGRFQGKSARAVPHSLQM